MPKPIQFAKKSDLIFQLKQCSWRAKFAEISRRHRETGLLGAICFSVMGSTFRAFRKNKSTGVGPARVFRLWAVETLYAGFLKELLAIKTQEQYDRWLRRLTKTLQGAWRHELGYPLDEGRALKLVNLLVKELCCVPPVEGEHFERLVAYLHVPLDSYTLQPLGAVARDIPELQMLTIEWPNASMGSVKTRREYEGIQSAIRKLATEARTVPIAYEVMAWDASHPTTYLSKSASAGGD